MNLDIKFYRHRFLNLIIFIHKNSKWATISLCLRDIKLSEESNLCIKSSLTLNNVSNHITIESNSLKPKKDIFYNIYILCKNKWSKVKTIKLEFNQFLEVNRDDLNVDSNKNLVVVPSEEITESSSQILPLPAKSHFNRSLISERLSTTLKLVRQMFIHGRISHKMMKLSKGLFSALTP